MGHPRPAPSTGIPFFIFAADPDPLLHESAVLVDLRSAYEVGPYKCVLSQKSSFHPPNQGIDDMFRPHSPSFFALVFLLLILRGH